MNDLLYDVTFIYEQFIYPNELISKQTKIGFFSKVICLYMANKTFNSNLTQQELREKLLESILKDVFIKSDDSFIFFTKAALRSLCDHLDEFITDPHIGKVLLSDAIPINFVYDEDVEWVLLKSKKSLSKVDPYKHMVLNKPTYLLALRKGDITDVA